jgi:hypothetical protein
VWPAVVPTNQLFDTLHRDRDLSSQKNRLRYFIIIAVAIFCVSSFPPSLFIPR